MIDFLKDVIEGLLLVRNSSCHHYVFFTTDRLLCILNSVSMQVKAYITQ